MNPLPIGDAASKSGGAAQVNQAGTVSDHFNVEQSIPARWASLVARQPSQPAIFSGDWQPTYGDMNAAANRLAHAVLARRGAIGDRVALLLRHDAPLLAAILAVLKAGRLVVVLNGGDPPARLRQVVADAEPAVIVTDFSHRTLAQELAGTSCEVIGWEEVGSEMQTDPNLPIPPESPAWLIYTSGSTGRPKGVIQTHRNILHNARRLTRGMDLRPDDRIALLASPSGGQGLATIWCAWAQGAALGAFPVMERGVSGLADWLVTNRVSAFIASASLFRNFLRTLDANVSFPIVRVVRLASEPATADDFAGFKQHFSPSAALFSTLSSSETGNITQHRISWSEQVTPGRLPVGRPAEGMEILLVNDVGEVVTPGETGEVAVRSRFLSPGYWRNDALTAQRFEAGASPDAPRTFRSGDLAQCNASGLLEFQGRKDAQIKVHGFRVETAEIEEALKRQAAVTQAAVVLQTADEDTRLVAFIVSRTGAGGDANRWRQALRAILPPSMVPAHFVFLEQLPLTPHGKVDRARLAEWKLPTSEHASRSLPETETERQLAAIWCEALRIASVSRTDDFQELGGDSLKAVVMAAKVYAALGVELDLRLLPQHSGLSAMAAMIDRRRREGPRVDGPTLERVPRDGPLPLSFAQLPMWRESQTAAGSADYTVALSYRIVGPLDVPALKASLEYLVGRHEILRVTFAERKGEPVHVVHPAGAVELPLHDVSGAADPARAATECFRRATAGPFDLRRGPLVRFLLARLGPEEHWFCRVNHHLISDAWSWQVFFRELAQVYEAKLRGIAPALPESEPLHYLDYAAWERCALDPAGPAYQASVQWWGDLLAACPPAPRLPFQRRWRWRRVAPAEGWIWWGIHPATSERLDRFGRTVGATYFVVRLAAFAALLAVESGEPEVVLRTYVTNRNRVETQKMFGFFANQATLRWRFEARRTFREWTVEVARLVGEARTHALIPHEQLRAELLARGVKPPKIRAIFSVADSLAPMPLGDAQLVWLDRRMESMPRGFTLACDPLDEAHSCRASFDARWYDPAGVRQWLERFGRWLDAVSREPDRPLSEVIEKCAVRPRLSLLRRLQRRLRI